jgi:hypothetical protein
MPQLFLGRAPEVQHQFGHDRRLDRRVHSDTDASSSLVGEADFPTRELRQGGINAAVEQAGPVGWRPNVAEAVPDERVAVAEGKPKPAIVPETKSVPIAETPG